MTCSGQTGDFCGHRAPTVALLYQSRVTRVLPVHLGGNSSSAIEVAELPFVRGLGLKEPAANYRASPTQQGRMGQLVTAWPHNS
jgi:hypothetical protein